MEWGRGRRRRPPPPCPACRRGTAWMLHAVPRRRGAGVRRRRNVASRPLRGLTRLAASPPTSSVASIKPPEQLFLNFVEKASLLEVHRSIRHGCCFLIDYRRAPRTEAKRKRNHETKTISWSLARNTHCSDFTVSGWMFERFAKRSKEVGNRWPRGCARATKPSANDQRICESLR
jgi:hypothetical protein